MRTSLWPAAIARATGIGEPHARLVLRRLREARLIPDGRDPPPFSSTEVARVLVGLTIDHLPSLADQVVALSAAPSRTVPAYGLPTAGDALARLVHGLLSGTVRPLGAVEINAAWRDVTLHSFDDDSHPVVQRFGSGDTERFGRATATTILPLTAAAAVARVLVDR